MSFLSLKSSSLQFIPVKTLTTLIILISFIFFSCQKTQGIDNFGAQHSTLVISVPDSYIYTSASAYLAEYLLCNYKGEQVVILLGNCVN